MSSMNDKIVFGGEFTHEANHWLVYGLGPSHLGWVSRSAKRSLIAA